MDERTVKRIYQPPAVPAADLFKGGKQRRVAAYARVSTASDEQLNILQHRREYNFHFFLVSMFFHFVPLYAFRLLIAFFP